MTAPISAGMIGFGLAGAVFHAQLIRAVPGLRPTHVCTSRTAEAQQAGLAVAESADAMLADPGIDLIVIASPNHTHFPLARAALMAGKHVVVDKPIAVTIEEADELIALARTRQRLLTVFHNRRWDGDFLTLRHLIDEGQLGEIMLYEAWWDRFRPTIKQGWRETATPGGGLLNDLGPHLIDQAISLFGWPEAISADIAAQRQGVCVDDYFALTLYYGEKRVRLGASTLVVHPRPRFAAHGMRGSFVKHGLDPQEAQLRAGILPTAGGFGVDAPEHYGTFYSADGQSSIIPTETGRWVAFYEAVRDAIRSGAPAPVDPADARAGLALIELARRSAREGRRLAADA